VDIGTVQCETTAGRGGDAVAFTSRRHHCTNFARIALFTIVRGPTPAHGTSRRRRCRSSRTVRRSSSGSSIISSRSSRTQLHSRTSFSALEWFGRVLGAGCDPVHLAVDDLHGGFDITTMTTIINTHWFGCLTGQGKVPAHGIGTVARDLIVQGLFQLGTKSGERRSETGETGRSSRQVQIEIDRLTLFRHRFDVPVGTIDGNRLSVGTDFTRTAHVTTVRGRTATKTTTATTGVGTRVDKDTRIFHGQHTPAVVFDARGRTENMTFDHGDGDLGLSASPARRDRLVAQFVLVFTTHTKTIVQRPHTTTINRLCKGVLYRLTNTLQVVDGCYCYCSICWWGDQLATAVEHDVAVVVCEDGPIVQMLEKPLGTNLRQGRLSAAIRLLIGAGHDRRSYYAADDEEQPKHQQERGRGAEQCAAISHWEPGTRLRQVLTCLILPNNNGGKACRGLFPPSNQKQEPGL
jgi:hypothetical protein